MLQTRLKLKAIQKKKGQANINCTQILYLSWKTDTERELASFNKRELRKLPVCRKVGPSLSCTHIFV